MRVNASGPGPRVKATCSCGRVIFHVNASTPMSAPSRIRSASKKARPATLVRTPRRSGTGKSGAAALAAGMGADTGPGTRGGGADSGSVGPLSAARSIVTATAAARARTTTPARLASPSPPSRATSAKPSRARAFAALHRSPSPSQTARRRPRIPPLARRTHRPSSGATCRRPRPWRSGWTARVTLQSRVVREHARQRPRPERDRHRRQPRRSRRGARVARRAARTQGRPGLHRSAPRRMASPRRWATTRSRRTANHAGRTAPIPSSDVPLCGATMGYRPDNRSER